MNAGTRMCIVLVAVGMAGCGWEAEAAATGQALEGPSCVKHIPGYPTAEDLEGDVPGFHAPVCGVAFGAETTGECNDCRDRGCTRTNEGWHTCVCHEEGEHCIPPSGPYPATEGSAGGGPPNPGGCYYEGKSCECDDVEGRVYTCQCQDDGSETSLGQPCWCQVVRDGSFDYEYQCEMK